MILFYVDGAIFRFLVIAFIFLAPLHSLVKAYLGFSIYPILALGLVSLLGVAGRGTKNKENVGLWCEPGNFLMLALVMLLAPKMQTLGDLRTLAGAIVVPYVIGVLFARVAPAAEQPLDEWLTAYLAAKVCLLLCFADVFMTAYPTRPLFEGKAIYLQFGWGLEVFPSLLLLIAQRQAQSRKRSLSVPLVCLGMLLSAFVLAGMNSRSLLLIALALTTITSVLCIRSSRLRIIGLFGFPLCLALSLGILPNRLDHLMRMLDTVLCQITAGNLFCMGGADRSSEMRLERIALGLLTPENLSYGAAPDFQSTFFIGSHFWPAQLFYYFGLFGLTVFLLILARFFERTFRLIRKAGHEDCYLAGLGLFAFAFGLHVFYAGNLLNDPVLFLLMGLAMNIRCSRPKTEGSAPNRELRSPPVVGDVRGRDK